MHQGKRGRGPPSSITSGKASRHDRRCDHQPPNQPTHNLPIRGALTCLSYANNYPTNSHRCPTESHDPPPTSSMDTTSQSGGRNSE